jgi:hypothetical protein
MEDREAGCNQGDYSPFGQIRLKSPIFKGTFYYLRIYRCFWTTLKVLGESPCGQKFLH